MKILLIEDEKMLNDDLKYFITSKGHTCDSVTKADQVIRLLEGSNEYNLIVLDLMMQRGEKLSDDESSHETGELLYHLINNKYPKAKIAILTAKNIDEINPEILSNPRVKFISKSSEDPLKELLEYLKGAQ